MNSEVIKQLIDVVRTKNDYDSDNSWFEGSETYFREIKLELDEVAEELDANRQCYLEDELGDVLWDYLNLLLCLEDEGKISAEKVFERALQKYSERMTGIQQGTSWAEVKQKQKQRLAQEQAEIEQGEIECPN
ncbi:MazG nucleotide pyrophosphohydrolase domain-containing protein [Endozoicomonas arenosclerae]|uniref:MazG nucleotide pyrophosphohydrolase domain-containing protein n=1 Tax=Endozoicomonas arenosclerae TaxID=1633495 RepID=UPI0007859EDE|nr:MazG nucleotide pyrophosphohydrolase domain-containing protein [Endozoicomonas arenosclerae]